eukprot:GGOE01057192.1.p1 GENE.GGOE01057192.1~~GGOE01057192.1.p1  ORF type:complete len:305 (+),score=95.17 GGOE01057192.1:125-1039(+)
MRVVNRSSSAGLPASVAEINALLIAQQLQPLALHPSLDAASAAGIAECVGALLQQRHKDAVYRDDAAKLLDRLHSEAEPSEQKCKRMAEAVDRLERDTALLRAKHSAADQESRRQGEQLRSSAEQLTRGNTQLQARLMQLHHKVARKEKEGEKLAEKVARQLQERERRGSTGPPALNDTQEDAVRCPSRRTEVTVDTSISDVYEEDLTRQRCELETLQCALYAFNSELARMTAHYGRGPVVSPLRLQYSAPLAYSMGPIDECFQSNLQALRSALLECSAAPSAAEISTMEVTSLHSGGGDLSMV